MRLEADAAAERITPAGALPDPRFRIELMDITKMGEQSATLLPNQVGSTKYTVLQELPWYGKRDLKRGIAEMQAEAAQGQARGAWAEIAAQLKTAHAQLYLLNRNEQLTREILDLMVRLEKVAQVRYAGGLAMQQDVIRSQIEQTGMRNDLIMLENDGTMLRARRSSIRTFCARFRHRPNWISRLWKIVFAPVIPSFSRTKPESNQQRKHVT
jgi:outer membrane protein TolC